MEKKSLKDTIIPTLNMNKMKGREIIRDWRMTKRPASPAAALRPGNIAFCRKYQATTVPEWDINPCILIFNTSSSYVLGFNVNWLSRSQRKMMINIIAREYKTNKGNMDRMQRLKLFKKLKKFNFTRKAIRVYHRSVLAKSAIYQLTTGEFFEACTHNLILNS